MAKDRDSDALGANQSKKPPAYLDNSDQPPPQPPPQQHRAKSQKHIVGGGPGGRLHARVPSSKGLYKHHATASTTKLNRRQGSVSPDRDRPSQQHRRTTSDLKLARDPSATDLKKNPSQTSLERNRSQVNIGKKTKSSTGLHRSLSSPAVDKVRSSASSRVQFNLGDDDQDDDQDDEWVDASTSASPLLSRRSSAVSAGQLAHLTADGEGSPAASPSARRREDIGERFPANGTHNIGQSLPRNKASHKQYLTSRILSRTPSHGAPPMMSAESVSVRPGSLRQHSPPTSSPVQNLSLSTTPGIAPIVRPGSSGKEELTSRFMGYNSQEPGSGMPGESFILAANRGGVTRAALNGKAGFSLPPRRESVGSISQARGTDGLNARRAEADDFADDDDVEQAPRSRRSVPPREMNRTQQKINLQRASSSLEPAHPHTGMAGVAPGAGPILGVPNGYDARDPRIGRLLERTGMEYLTVRRHLNPVARSVARLMQLLPGPDDSRRIPRTRAARPAARASERNADFNPHHSMADLIGDGGPAARRRPPRPRSTFSAMDLNSAGSSPDTDGGPANGIRGRPRLSGSSLVDGPAEDAGTEALLRMMWDKNMDLSASQD